MCCKSEFEPSPEGWTGYSGNGWDGEVREGCECAAEMGEESLCSTFLQRKALLTEQ